MPSSNFNTQTDFSTQVKQYSGTTATLSGNTNILGTLKVKSIEIDTTNFGLIPTLGNVLVYDGTKFIPAPNDTYGSTILNGMVLTYNSGLTYNVSSGGYRINGVTYDYTGGSITIVSGNNLYNRFDVVFVTGYTNTFVKSGTPLFAPTVPTLNSTQLQIGIISVPVNFTGGTGSTVIQITGDTVFEFYPTGTGIQRAGSNNAEAIGQYSFALSRDAKAYGQDSIALGLGIKASGQSQTVVGQYNDPNISDYFIVGNGTVSTPSNAFRVTTGGSSYVQNKLFVTNIEIETTGGSSNHALISDGTKFKSQLLTLQKITESGNTTTNSIGVNQLTGTSIFLSSGFTFISGYNSYSNPSELRVLLADDLGGIESKTDTYQLNYFTENVTKGINPLTRGVYSSFTSDTSFSYDRTSTTITVGKESFVKITGITSGDTAIGTVFRNRFETKNYNANNGVDDTTKNLVGTAFFNQFDSSRYNTTPLLGTMMETHLLGNQQGTSHFEVRNLHLGFFNRAWTDFGGDPGAININTSAYDIYINRPVINAKGYNSFDNGENIEVNIKSYASIFIESKEKISLSDALNRPLTTSATITYTNTPWSLFAEADRAYIGSTLVLASAQTLSSTTRGAWLDIGASQATRPHINLSAGTDPSSPQIGDLWWNGTQLYFRKDASTSVNLLSGGTGSSSTGLTTGTNLGDGVKVLFSSDTTNLGFATLSSQTPSTLRIISSSTGVILFSATTGSGGISGTYVSGITSAGTGNISILSTITDNKLVYKTISAGTGININDVDDTLTFITNNYEYMDLSTAQAYSAFTVGQWYRIPVSSRSVTEATNYNTYGDIMLMAVDTNKLSPDGYLLAINADYQDVGDYSDVSDFNQNYGVPYNGITVGSNVSIITDIVIYNNRHWAASAEYTLTDESSITSNLTPLTKDYTTRNGYIIEPQKIVYNLAIDTINRMEDKRGNIFNSNDFIENFRFGDNDVFRNQIFTTLDCNLLNYPNLTFYYNIMKFGTIVGSTDLISNGVVLSITDCNIQDYSFKNDYLQSLYLTASNIQDKKILSAENQITITSSTLTLPMMVQGTGWYYDQPIFTTGGTFNGIVTAITQGNQIVNYYQKFRFANLTNSTNIIFRNSASLKTEGGLDAIITNNNYDSIEFYLAGGIAYQTDINNYV